MDIYSIGVKADTRDIDRGKKRLDDFAKSADTVDKSTGKTRESLGKLVKGANQVDGAIAKANKSILALNSAFGIFSGIVGGITIGKVVSDLADFEEAMAKLQAITFASGEEMARFREQARTLGATTIKTAKEVAEAQTFFAMAGFSANEVLSATPGIIAMSTAASLDLAKAADIASNVLSGFGYEVSELNRVNDVLTKTASSANTSVEQLGSALSYVAPFAATANISIEETASAIGKLGDAGLQGERGGTGLVGVIRQLSKVTPQAKEVLDSVGVSVKDVDVSVNGLQNVMSLLATKNLSLAETFTIFGTEAGPAASILMKSAEGMRELTAANENAEGTTQKAADIISNSLNASILSFNSAISESILQVGESQSYLNDLIKTVTGVISVYNGMMPQFVETNKLSYEQAKNIENIALGFQLLGTAVGTLAAIRTALFLAEAAQTAFNTAVFKNPYVLIATTAVTAAVAVYKLQQATSDIEQVWENASKSSEHYQAALSRQSELDSHLASLNKERETRLAALAEAEKMLKKVTAEGSEHAIKNYKRQVEVHRGYADKIESDIKRIESSRDLATKNYEEAKKREEEAAKKAYEEAIAFANAEAEKVRKRIAAEIEAQEELKKTQRGLESLWRQADPVAAKLKDIEDGFLLIEKAMEMGMDPKYIEAVTKYLEKMIEDLGTVADDVEKSFKDLFNFLYPSDAEMRKISEAYNGLEEAMNAGILSPEEYKRYLNRIDEIAEKALGKSEETTTQMISVYEEAAKRIDAVFADAWMNLDEGFNGVADGLMDAFKRMLAEMAHAATTQKIMVDIGMQQAGGVTINPYAAAGAIAILSATAAINKHNADDEKRMEKFTSEYRQKEQNTGTVLGDIKSKSSSIDNLTNSLEKIESDSLSVNRNMYNSLKNIETSITKSSAGISRSLTTSGAFSFMPEEMTTSDGRAFEEIAMAHINKITLGFTDDLFGGVISGIASAISSKKTELQDVGLFIGNQTLAEIENGLAAATYKRTRVTKTNFGFSSSKSYIDLEAIGRETSSEIQSVFLSIADVLKESSYYLAKGGQDVEEIFKNLSVVAEELSLKDLNAEEQAKVIQEYFSKIGDLWAQEVAEALGVSTFISQFQQAGEGLFETIGRVVLQAKQLEFSFRAIEKVLGGTNEDIIKITQNMSDFAGGFDNLNNAISDYYSKFFTEEERAKKQLDLLASALSEVGINSVPQTHQAFRDIVDAVDLTTESGQKLFVRLMELAPVVDEVTTASEKAAKAQKDIVDKYNAQVDVLTKELLTARGDEQALRQLELNTIDQSLWGLKQRTWAIEDEKKANEEMLRVQSERLGLENTLLNLLGDVDELRKREIEKLDESNRPLQERIWAIEDEKKATEAAKEEAEKLKDLFESGLAKSFEDIKNAAEKEKTALNEIISAREEEINAINKAKEELTSGLSSSLSKLKDSIDAQKDVVTKSYDAIFSSFNASIQKTKDSITSLKSISSSLFEAINNVKIASEDIEAATIFGARMQLSAAAKSGTIPNNLDTLLGAATNDTEKFFGSFEAYAKSQAQTKNDIEALYRTTENQISYEEKTLKNLESQLSLAQTEYEDTIKKLDSQYTLAEKQYNKILGIDNSILSVSDAVANFEAISSGYDKKMQSLIYDEVVKRGIIDSSKAQIEAIEKQVSIQQNQYNALLGIDSSIKTLADAIGVSSVGTSLESELRQIYRDVLGREADQAGLNWWIEDIGNTGKTIAMVRELFENSPEAKGFASGGYHSGGLRIVGENGPELEMTGPSRIISNSDTRNMLDTTSLQAEVRELRNDLKMSQYQIAKNTGKTAKYIERWEGDGLPPERVA